MQATQMGAALVSSGDRRFVSNRDESCRMFRNTLFERLSYVHPIVPHVIYLPAIGLFLWQAAAVRPVADVVMLVGAGLLVWTWTEYVIHRFVFHPPPQIEEDTRHILSELSPGDACMSALPTWRHKFYFLVHGVHHDFPSDTHRLVMPPSVSLPLAALFYLGFLAMLGPRTPAVFAGFLMGYLYYDTTHYLTHHGPTRTALGRFQRKRHFRHHYADSTHDYGVSSPLWDVLLGTIGRSRDRQPSPGSD